MPRLSDELYSRPERMKIFVSSEMSSGSLRRERRAAAEAIERTGIASPWWWEMSARAGPYSAARVCLGHARTSDGLVLILATQLTSMTRREYLAARSRGVPRYIMLKASASRDGAAERFVRREQRDSVTEPFRNLSELRTRVVGALAQQASTAVRREILRAQQRAARAGSGDSRQASQPPKRSPKRKR